MFPLHHRVRRPSRFLPRCEVLEDRAVPAASATFINGTIFIKGELLRADNIRIEDGGGAGQVTVFVGGAQVLQRAGSEVQRISLNMRGGKDVVVYNLTGSLGPASREVSGQLGTGDDAFTANVNGLVAGGELKFNVRGELGRDQMNVVHTSSLTAGSNVDCKFDGGGGNDILSYTANTGVNVEQGATLTVNLLGGNDKDTMNTLFTGDVDGQLNMTSDGGRDRDTVNINATLAPGSGILADGSTAPGTSIAAQVFGRNDNDNLTLVINKQGAGTFPVTAQLDGGGQRDTCSTAGSTVPVTLISCP